MRALLKLLGRDWIRAPISGTEIIVLGVLAIVALVTGHFDRGLLLLVLMQTISNGRDR